jgi:hypothetical protein
MTTLSEHLFEYMEKKIKGFTKMKKGGGILFTCPNSHKHRFPSRTPTATYLPNSEKISCLICSWKGSQYDIIRTLEEDKNNWSDAEITNYLIQDLQLSMYKELESYEKYGWSLVANLKNSNKAFEEDWNKKEYKEKIKWIKWLNNGLNIGVVCSLSGIIAIDVDVKKEIQNEDAKKLREEIISLCEKGNTLEAKTPSGGRHFVFLWEEELRKQIVNGCGTQIDTRTEGQIVIAPSKRDGKVYEWINLGIEIKKMSDELKSKLLKFQEVEKGRIEEKINKELDDVVYEGEKLIQNDEYDACNDSFVKLGGVLTKLDITQDKRATILHWINKNWVKNPMDPKAINGMLGSLSGYEASKEESHEIAIYNFLELMNSDVSPNDVVKGVFNNDQSKSPIVYKYLSKLVKEGKATRSGRGRYQYKQVVGWDDSIPQSLIDYPYKVPYFHPYETFVDGDLILLGLPTNCGKSTISLNIVKEMIEQNVKPYYLISGEASSRWQRISDTLNITGKFYRFKHPNPIQIELQYNSFTVIDWLHLGDKSISDSTIKHLSDELERKRGILLVFTQIRKNYEWFAPDLIDHFPTFAARYIHEDLEKKYGHWEIDKAKDLHGGNIIPCEYDHKTRIFKAKDLI